MSSIRNIYCVGRNYVLHAKELNNEVPTSPFMFSKPTHALVEANGNTIVLPGERGSVHYETELVIRIGKPYEKGIAVDELVNGLAIGIDFTLRDIQNEMKKRGYPWLLAKGFPNSAVVSKFVTFPGVERCKSMDFVLIKNGVKAQQGNIQHMLFDLQTIIDFSAQHFGLGEGDIIFTGTPEGVGEIADGDHMSLLWGGQIVGECTVHLA
ncbi:2-keto-4-pentenoate hydratase/2-oxohepta-3-ene-1,7-dioic acid hydratase (catechol pathway) [Paenibacillus sp. 1_12]|uniref:fumarylacetoacetate hydrolase family protein n=1 Tax=Paenibacillus sp. 1_12 TaxID=1566278 RepID=UPI0008E2BEBF|nr:fumarylacetoacetate hydrolase family protein [Paenibacillus sp. 1_12]SFK68015.1 2-keto-4-pentenoate hydratase/2-oxohepta-3-ene-1,7-dioic acid hydratase (catechol pathway) [Paenibacillus sp. 1_12]